jgi:hypothetical protein
MSNLIEERKQLTQEIFADLKADEVKSLSLSKAIAEGTLAGELTDDKLITDLKEGKEFLVKIVRFVRPFIGMFGSKCKTKIEKFFAAFDVLFPDVE